MQKLASIQAAVVCIKKKGTLLTHHHCFACISIVFSFPLPSPSPHPLAAFLLFCSPITSNYILDYFHLFSLHVFEVSFTTKNMGGRLGLFFLVSYLDCFCLARLVEYFLVFPCVSECVCVSVCVLCLCLTPPPPHVRCPCLSLPIY